jgi:hypothetical protein
MAHPRLRVRLTRDPVVVVERQSINARKLVYVIVADRQIAYGNGRSRIAYIGTTQHGLNRIASSIAARAPDVLSIRGVRRFEVHVLTTDGRRHVKTWVKLERAMLLVFKEQFGEVPVCNRHGRKFIETDEFRYFTRTRIERIIDGIS